MTKEEMLKETKEQLGRENISDDIKRYLLLVCDGEADSTVTIAHCSCLEMLQFLSMGIVSLARIQGFSIQKVAEDAAKGAMLISEAEQKEKEND